MTDYHPPESDDRAAADLSAERRERSLAALYDAAMLGLPNDELRHLCNECGIAWAELEAYTPPLLRPKQKEDKPALDPQYDPF